MEGLSSISHVGLIPFEHQTRNPEAIFKDVKENIMVNGVKSSAQVQKDKNSNMTSAINVSCNAIVYGDVHDRWTEEEEEEECIYCSPVKPPKNFKVV